MEFNKKFLKEKVENAKEKEGKGFDALINYPAFSQSVVRQDLILTEEKEESRAKNLVKYPLKVEYNPKLLKKWNKINFYDVNCFLGRISLTACAVNETFHKEMKSIYGIDPLTMKNEKKSIFYCEGPMKEMGRCRAKAENDYSKEKFPTCAKVLDIVRCSIVFETCQGCVEGIDALKKAISSGKWSITDIGRLKNM